jgi:uncharacterized RmlC-like cupin family protein
MQTLGIIILDTPQLGVTEVLSSSYGLSLFSSKVGSHLEENAVVVPGELLSVSVGVLWLGIDLLDEAGFVGTSVILRQELLENQM